MVCSTKLECNIEAQARQSRPRGQGNGRGQGCQKEEAQAAATAIKLSNHITTKNHLAGIVKEDEAPKLAEAYNAETETDPIDLEIVEACEMKGTLSQHQEMEDFTAVAALISMEKHKYEPL